MDCVNPEKAVFVRLWHKIPGGGHQPIEGLLQHSLSLRVIQCLKLRTYAVDRKTIDAPAIRHEWVMLRLGFARAKELQSRMADLLNEYKSDDQGTAYLACVTLAPMISS